MVLLILFFPVFEILFSIWATGLMGFGESLLLIAMAFFIGLSIMRAVGLNFPLKFQEEIVRGRTGGRTLVKGAFRFLAAALLMFPGFLSDTIAILLLVLSFVPGIEKLAAKFFTKVFRAQVIFTKQSGGFHSSEGFGGFEDFDQRPVRDVTPKKPDSFPKRDDQV